VKRVDSSTQNQKIRGFPLHVVPLNCLAVPIIVEEGMSNRNKRKKRWRGKNKHTYIASDALLLDFSLANKFWMVSCNSPA